MRVVSVNQIRTTPTIVAHERLSVWQALGRPRARLGTYAASHWPLKAPPRLHFKARSFAQPATLGGDQISPAETRHTGGNHPWYRDSGQGRRPTRPPADQRVRHLSATVLRAGQMTIEILRNPDDCRNR